MKIEELPVLSHPDLRWERWDEHYLYAVQERLKLACELLSDCIPWISEDYDAPLPAIAEFMAKMRDERLIK